jgi:hypothetical protein
VFSLSLVHFITRGLLSFKEILWESAPLPSPPLSPLASFVIKRSIHNQRAALAIRAPNSALFCVQGPRVSWIRELFYKGEEALAEIGARTQKRKGRRWRGIKEIKETERRRDGPRQKSPSALVYSIVMRTKEPRDSRSRGFFFLSRCYVERTASLQHLLAAVALCLRESPRSQAQEMALATLALGTRC